MMPRNRKRPEAGIALVVFAVMAAMFMSVLGLVLDGGRLYFERRRAQLAADAGAYGAAQELRRGNRDYATDIRPAAINDTTLHGFTDANATITVNVPPLAGSRAGDPNFVEIIIEDDVPSTFMRWFGRDSAGVAGRAVAGVRRSGDACVIALDPDDSRSFRVNGNATLVSGCGIMVNSTAQDAFQADGPNECVTATYIGAAGGAEAGLCVSPTPQGGVLPIIDPLGHMTPPSAASVPIGTTTSGGGAGGLGGGTVYWPGYYDKEIKIQGGAATFMPGTYVLEAGIKISGGTVSGSEVFFYNLNSKGNTYVDVGGNAIVNLSAPTSGPYTGMLFMGPRNGQPGNPGNKIARGNSGSSFTGTVYFPSEHLDYAGNPLTVSSWAMIIANTINISGTADGSVINPPSEGQAPPSYQTILIE